MKKTILALSLLVGMSSTASVFAALPQSIRIGTDATYAPFSSKDAKGDFVGFDIDLGNELCSRIKVKCTWVGSDFDSLDAQADHFLIYFFLQLPTSFLSFHFRMKTGNAISDTWNMFSIRTATTWCRFYCFFLLRKQIMTLLQVTAFLFASPPVTVLAGPWLFFAVLSSLNSCIWFYDQIFISLHSVLPLFS